MVQHILRDRSMQRCLKMYLKAQILMNDEINTNCSIASTSVLADGFKKQEEGGVSPGLDRYFAAKMNTSNLETPRRLRLHRMDTVP